MPRPNWFFAFPFDGSFLRELPPLPPSFRLFHEEDVHMTLAFLGGVGEEAALRALAALDEQWARAPLAAFEVSLAEIAPMGSSRREYTALSALLADGRAAGVAAIAAYRDTLTMAASGRVEKRAPKPHVTIARPRARANREAGLAWAASVDVRHVRARLERVALYTWSEDRRGRMFRVFAERRLA